MFPLEAAVPRPQFFPLRVGHAHKEAARRNVLAVYLPRLEPVAHGLAGDAQHRRDLARGRHAGVGGGGGCGHEIAFPIFIDKKRVMSYVFPTQEQARGGGVMDFSEQELTTFHPSLKQKRRYPPLHYYELHLRNKMEINDLWMLIAEIRCKQTIADVLSPPPSEDERFKNLSEEQNEKIRQSIELMENANVRLKADNEHFEAAIEKAWRTVYPVNPKKLSLIGRIRDFFRRLLLRIAGRLAQFDWEPEASLDPFSGKVKVSLKGSTKKTDGGDSPKP